MALSSKPQAFQACSLVWRESRSARWPLFCCCRQIACRNRSGSDSTCCITQEYQPSPSIRIIHWHKLRAYSEAVDVNGAWTITSSHLLETGQLLRKYGLLLLTILLGARLIETLLMHLAVELGMMHSFIGLLALIMVILLKLIVFACVFVDRKSVGLGNRVTVRIDIGG